jgi:hypothetical protein
MGRRSAVEGASLLGPATHCGPSPVVCPPPWQGRWALRSWTTRDSALSRRTGGKRSDSTAAVRSGSDMRLFRAPGPRSATRLPAFRTRSRARSATKQLHRRHARSETRGQTTAGGDGRPSFWIDRGAHLCPYQSGVAKYYNGCSHGRRRNLLSVPPGLCGAVGTVSIGA